MRMSNRNGFDRRQFIRAAGSAAALGSALGAGGGVAIVIDPGDPVASAAPARWAAKELQNSLAARGVGARIYESAAQAPAGDLRVVAAGMASSTAAAGLQAAGVRAAAVPEALAVSPGTAGGKQILLACGHDARGL